MMMEDVEHVIVGAGPAGLRAAQVLAEAGREVVVLERNAEVGPKTCAGGLSMKAVRELDVLGLPEDIGRTFIARGSFRGEAPYSLDASRGRVRTVSRRTLGTLQRRWTEQAGAEVRTSVYVTRLNLHARVVEAEGRRSIRYRHLIGADGSASRVRHALGLPSPRTYFAGEFNVPGVRLPHLEVFYDPSVLAHGYFWVFPHSDFTSVGAGADRMCVPPARIRPYLESRLRALGIPVHTSTFEGASIEVEFVGFHARNGVVHLVGDAAGVASGLTGEGIYSALITGEEVARRILDPRFPSPKTRAWLRAKRLHDRIAAVWRHAMPRAVSFELLRCLLRSPTLNRHLTALFLGA